MSRPFCFPLSLILFLACPVAKSATLPINTENVKKSVVFLYYQRDADGSTCKQTTPCFEAGTGFLVGIPDRNEPGQIYLAIVTARHVIDPQWDGCSWANPKVLFARVNTKDYKAGGSKTGSFVTKIDLSAKEAWFVSSDDEVDVAVIPIGPVDAPKILEMDAAPLALSEFGTKEEIDKFKIGIGDGILSAGLVPALFDTKRNYPAFKFGKISNVFDEPVKTRCEGSETTKDRLAWIIAGNFVPGNSGSPVFLLPLELTISAPLQYNGPRPMIIGLLSSTIEGADLGEMVPVEFIFDVIKQHYPNGNLYRGSTPAPAAKTGP